MDDSSHGALLIDKPAGLTSSRVVQRIKRQFGLRRVGHSGTLDPFATGLLVVLVGDATRLQSFVLEGDKSYSGTIRLGVSTDTDDITGNIIYELDPKIDDRVSCAADLVQRLSGTLFQRPPPISAIKVGGKRSYALAREGQAVELEPREVTIHDIALEFLDAKTLRYEIECSKGTYIRAVARDIGELLGCGACVETLRRECSGKFSVADAVPLEDLKEPLKLVALESLLAGVPRATVCEEDILRLYCGDQSPLGRIEIVGELCAIQTAAGRFVGLIERDQAARWRIKYLRPSPFTPTP